MNRFYKTEDYLSLIDKINETFENPFLGSDVIAGFAGETDEDFEITKQILKIRFNSNSYFSLLSKKRDNRSRNGKPKF